MKKQLLPLFLGLSLLWSCKKQDVASPTPNETNQTSTRKKLATGDAVWDVLGYGYNVTGKYADGTSATFKILDIARLAADYPNRVEKDQSKYQYENMSAGADAAAYSDSITKKVSLSLFGTATGGEEDKKKKQFSLSLAEASNNSSSKFSSKYVYASFDKIIQTKRLKINATVDLLKNYLTPEFNGDIQNATPAYLVATYGTHVMVDVILGGKLTLRYRSATQNSNRYNASVAGLNAGITGIFKLDTRVTVNKAESSSNTEQKLHYETIGGDPGKSLTPGDIVLGGNNNTTTINTATWQASVNESNSQLIDWSPNSFIPIYELITDPTKKAQVKAYVDQYLIDHNVSLLPDPIWLYYSFQYSDHFTTPFDLGYGGYQLYGSEFKAFLSQAPGTVPVYEFVNMAKLNHYNSVEPNATGSNPEWVNQGITYYAYPTQQPGTVPIYLYYSGRMRDHYVTPVATGFGPDWVRVGIAFYAFPNNQ